VHRGIELGGGARIVPAALGDDLPDRSALAVAAGAAEGEAG